MLKINTIEFGQHFGGVRRNTGAQTVAPQVDLSFALERFYEVLQIDHVADDACFGRNARRVAVASIVEREHVIAEIVEHFAHLDSSIFTSILLFGLFV